MTSLSDLPIELIEQILNNLEALERLIARKVSHSFRAIIDNLGPNLKTVHVNFHEKFSRLILDENYGGVTYEQVDGACQVEYKTSGRVHSGRNHVEMLMEDLKSLVKYPEVDEFLIQLATNNFDERKIIFKAIESFFKSLNFKLKAKKVIIDDFTAREVSAILQKFEPEILEEITLQTQFLKYYEPLNGVVELEQWKKGKILNNRSKFLIPIKHLVNFTQFDINVKDLTTDDALEIRDILIKSSTLESGYFRSIIANSVAIPSVFEPDHPFRKFALFEFKTPRCEFQFDCGPNYLSFQKKSL